MTKIVSTAFAAALLSLSLSASATTITFNSLEQAGSGYQTMTAYEENGFRVSSDALFASAGQGNADAYMGSAGLFNVYAGSIATLTKIGGSTFDFNAIDLAPLAQAYGSEASVSFIGNVHGGGTINQSFTLDGNFTFQTFAFSGFNNLDSVTWQQVFPYHQFDNLVLDRAASAVPEPGTLVLCGLALAVMGALLRKKA
jgi:hypothetical protein